MPRRVVIHARFHKTGSNSVQQTLRLNRPVLRRVMASVLKPMMRDVVGAARAYSVTGDPLDRARFAARMVLLLQDQPPMNRRVLCLSSEELAGHLPGRPGVQDYRAILTLSEDIVSAASSLFPQAEIVFFFLTRELDFSRATMGLLTAVGVVAKLAGFAAYNRGEDSSNSGHAGTQNVFWNVAGEDADTRMSIYQVGHGYVIGTRDLTPMVEPDILDAAFGYADGAAPTDWLEGEDLGATLWPTSLYEAQLALRLAQ